MMNKAFIDMKHFNSGSLTPLDSYFHRILEGGLFHVEIFQNERFLRNHEIRVINDSNLPNQINVDIGKHFGTSAKRCEEMTIPLKLQEGGIVLWYTSTPLYNWSISGEHLDSNDKFNSMELKFNDALSKVFLDSGRYIIINTSNSDHKMHLQINPLNLKLKHKEQTKQTLNPLKIRCSKQGFSPENAIAMIGQNIVWYIQENATYSIQIKRSKIKNT